MIAGNNVGKFKILPYLWQNAEVIVSIEDELGISRFPACFTLNAATVLPSGKRGVFFISFERKGQGVFLQ